VDTHADPAIPLVSFDGLPSRNNAGHAHTAGWDRLCFHRYAIDRIVGLTEPFGHLGTLTAYFSVFSERK